MILFKMAISRFLDLIRYGVKSWSYKRNRINHKLDSNRASSIALSSEIPTSLYLNTNLGCTLPNFEPNKNVSKLTVDLG